MTLKFSPNKSTNEISQMLENHQSESYKNLENHAWTGGCSCYQYSDGLHILNACVEGRRLSERHADAKKLLERYKEDNKGQNK